MSELKHAPGPWELDGIGVYPVSGHRAHDAICEMSPGQENARYSANARLIVAAPEILEALIGMVYLYRLDIGEVGTELAAALAAIAKATGSQLGAAEVE